MAEAGAPGRTITLTQFLVGQFVVLGLCVAALVIAMSWGTRTVDTYFRRAVLSQDQLSLVTRLELDVTAILLGKAWQQPGLRDQHDLDISLRRYVSSIRLEGRLLKAERLAIGDYAREPEMARALGAAVARIKAGKATTQQLSDLRARIHAIVVHEQAETFEILSNFNELRVQTMRGTMIAVALILLMSGATAFTLWRNFARPIRALSTATSSLAEGAPFIRVVPAGITELRNLAQRFNDMAQEIERQVAAKTAELIESNSKLSEIDRTRRLFFAKVSHELRTPLTVLRGEAETALRSPAASPERLREALDHILANSDFLQRRLQDLLATAQSEHGSITLNTEILNLADVLKSAAGIAAPFARSSEVRLDQRISGGYLPVEADPVWLRQALLAVIDNAVKFAGNPGLVTLYAAKSASGALIEIADNGLGTDELDVDRIFEPYFQSAQSRGYGGTGLGLALARWVVERHGGIIMARNRDEGGLLISITLPLAA